MKTKAPTCLCKLIKPQLWYAQPNDLVGGWCVTNFTESLSQRTYLTGDEIIEVSTAEMAAHIANLLNQDAIKSQINKLKL